MALAPFRVSLTLVISNRDFDLPQNLLAGLADRRAQGGDGCRGIEIKNVGEVLRGKVALRLQAAAGQQGVGGADDGGVSEGRLVIVKKGPNGYGDPVAETRGTVLLAGERLLFMADHQPVVLGTEEPFDVSLAAVPSGEAVRTAEKFAVEYLDVKYFNEVTVDAAASDGNSRFCWAVSFSWSGQQECIVYVNTQTGEVENSFIPDEGQG